MTDYSVLTGDLVRSSGLSASQLDGAMGTLAAAARRVALWGDGMTIGFSRRGGDGWQMALPVPALDLRCALYLQASLRVTGKRAATRIALARGPGTLPDSGDTNAASGPAFLASGRLLDTLTGPHATMAHAAGGALAAATRLADHICRGWTPAQARALCEMLPPDPPTHAAAAARLGISRQAVDQALTSSGYHALSEALSTLETAP